MFHGERILTAQVKSGYQDWNYAETHGIYVHFRVNLRCMDDNLRLYEAEIRWKRIDVPDSEFKSFGRESINEMFE